MNVNSVDFVASYANRFNLDDLIDTIAGYDPTDFKKQITRLYIFVSNAAIHKGDLSQEELEAVDLMQQIMESMEDIEDPENALLRVRVR